MQIVKVMKKIFLIALLLQINSFAQWNKIKGPFENLPINHIYVFNNNLYVGAGWDLFISTDGGINWSNILSGPFIRSLFVDNNNIYVGTADQGIKMSTDNGISWNNSLTASTIMDIIKIDSLLYVGTNNGLFISNNNNDRWTSSNNGIPDKYKYAAKFSKCGSNLFLLAYWQVSPDMGTSIFLSTDNGSNWKNIINNMEIRIIMDMTIDGNNLFMSASDDTYSGIFKSTNNGETWNHLGNNGLAPNTANFLIAKGTNLFAGTESGVYLTTDNGNNWKSVSSDSFNSSVSAAFVNDSDIYIGTYGNIWKSSFSEITGINNNINIPNDFQLEQNYPNPFNNSTTIRYKIPNKSFVQLDVYNILGQKITTLVQEEKEVGDYEIQFYSEKITSGIYLYRIIADGFLQTKKMILLK